MKRRRGFGASLAARLVLFGLVACLPTIAVILYLESELRGAREAEIFETARRQTQQATSELDRFVEGTRMLLVAVASAPSVRAAEPAACRAFLDSIVAETPSLRGFAVVDPEGTRLCASEGAQPPPDPAFVAAIARDGRFRVGTLLAAGPSPLDGVLPFGMAIRANGGGPASAVVVAMVEIAPMNRLVNEWALSRGGALTLADSEGVIIARSPQPERFIGTRIPAEFDRWVHGGALGVERAMSQDGTARIIAYKPVGLPPVGLYLSSGLAEAEAFGTLDTARRRGLAVILAGTALALVGAWWVGRRFVRRPVTDLVALAEAWRSGRRREVAARPSVYEFAAIAAALDRMGSELEEREAAARQSEDRLRRTIRAAPHPFMLHAEDGTILEVSDSWVALAGEDRAALTSSLDWTERAVRPRGADDPILHPFALGRIVGGLERVVVTGDGRERIWDFSIVPLEPLGDGRRLCLTTAVDVTERYRAAEQQTLLLRELDHRVKNTLATVQSIAAQTFRSTPDPDAFRQKFSERLGALARTHDMLTKGNWRGVSLRDMIEGEIAHVPGPERIAVSGEDVVLPSDMAVPVGLILHELTTNAIKYGALSAPDGRLAIDWRHEPGGEAGASLVLTWAERDGPPVAPPARTGFGSRLIGQLARALGEAESAYDADGLRFRLRIDLPERPESEAAPGPFRIEAAQ